ncbi:hypothetical protein EIN_405140 [Entamoeba invadens IP1]|uniref:Nucleosome assembly protein n=1 Tax=Entamoeba invadens IP1 TaxID=370355 RepID=A0A0A1U700_ENTIV|nr:hypothetical protein EIN_405140 [Entamoeba invadens IP1]ELP90100.1 hypothetical protein EIN_405140 [Entamoeba invadens IP1]|eukprot:XP_004256871.1 hypothetical protein EIN_405140 [Entamoeba invadens IP1]
MIKIGQSHIFSDINTIIKTKSIQDYINTTVKGVERNIDLLKEVNAQIKELQMEYNKECINLRIASEQDIKSYLSLRRAIIEGKSYDNIDIDKSGVKDFWTRVFYYSGFTKNVGYTEQDTELSMSLIDIEMKTAQPVIEHPLALKVTTEYTFIFNPNKYLKSTQIAFTLTQKYNETMHSIPNTSSIELITPIQPTDALNDSQLKELFLGKRPDGVLILMDAFNSINFKAISFYFNLFDPSHFLDDESDFDSEEASTPSENSDKDDEEKTSKSEESN